MHDSLKVGSLERACDGESKNDSLRESCIILSTPLKTKKKFNLQAKRNY